MIRPLAAYPPGRRAEILAALGDRWTCQLVAAGAPLFQVWQFYEARALEALTALQAGREDEVRRRGDEMARESKRQMEATNANYSTD